MKKRAYLSLLELSIMICVFALICAGSLQLFSVSCRQAKTEKELSLAALACASRIEEIKNEKKLPEQPVFFDENFEPVPSDGIYRVDAELLPDSIPYLKRALVSASDAATGRVLYQARCGWQVDRDE